MEAAFGEIVARFGLGEPCGPPQRLGGDSSAQIWGLDTSAGRWVVKTVAALGDWHVRAVRRAGRLERAAWAAGLPLPRPLEPPAPAVGSWHDAGGRLARVLERLDGHAAASPADASLAAWLGLTVARIAGLGLPGDLDEDGSAPLHPVVEWRAWVEEAAAGRFPVAEPAAGLLPVIADATELVEAASASRPSALLAHRDVRPENALVTGSGYVLLDWDHGGPGVPWWELVHTAFRSACASGLVGPSARPSPATVRGIVTAYLAAGGPPGPADASAFAGMLRSMLNWAAYNLWLALGYRDATPARRVRAAQMVAAASDTLPHVLRSIDRWARLLEPT